MYKINETTKKANNKNKFTWKGEPVLEMPWGEPWGPHN